MEIKPDNDNCSMHFYLNRKHGKSESCVKEFPPIEQSTPIFYSDESGTRIIGAKIFGQRFMNADEAGNADRRLGSKIDQLSAAVVVIGVLALCAFVMGVVALSS